MLKSILAFFQRQPKQSAVTSPAADPKWTEYKQHLRRQKLRARREMSTGFVPAILEHVDRDYVLGALLAAVFIRPVRLAALKGDVQYLTPESGRLQPYSGRRRHAADS